MQSVTHRGKLADGIEFVRRRLKFIVPAALVLGALATAIAVPGIRSRTQVVALKATGQIPDLPWRDLIDFLRPDSGVSLGYLVSRKNPHAVIRLKFL